MNDEHSLRLVAMIERLSADLEATKANLRIKEDMLVTAIRDRHQAERRVIALREQMAGQESEDRRLKAWIAVLEARQERACAIAT